MNNLSFAALTIAALLFISSSSSAADEVTAAAASPAASPSLSTSSLGCDNKCEYRCSRAGYKERCLKYCGICCEKCHGCVPSGPYADKAQCPCYGNLKNSKGKDKCP